MNPLVLLIAVDCFNISNAFQNFGIIFGMVTWYYLYSVYLTIPFIMHAASNTTHFQYFPEIFVSDRILKKCFLSTSNL